MWLCALLLTAHLPLHNHRDSTVMNGKTRLEMIVIQMLADTTLQLPVPPGLEHLGPTLSGPAAVVLCQLLGGMLEHAGPDTWLSTNPDTFKSAKGDLCVAAYIKANQGWLFPMERALCYIGKPALFIRHADIRAVEFQRANKTSSTFDMVIHATGKPIEFGQIEQAQLSHIQAYFARSRVQMTAGDANGPAAVPSSSKASVAAAAVQGGINQADDDVDSDEEDEDYNPERLSDDDGDAAGAGRSKKKQRMTAGFGEVQGGADGAESEDIGSDDSDDADDGEEGEEDEDGDKYESSDDAGSAELVEEDDLEQLSDP
eukprot:jgi/Chrzof1/11758/Cz06g08180.t1